MRMAKRMCSGKSTCCFMRRTAWIMVFSIICSNFVLPVHAEDHAPSIEGKLTMSFKRDVWSEDSYRLSPPGAINVIFDYSGCDRQQYDEASVAGINLLWEDRSYPVYTYLFLDKFHTAVVDVEEAFSNLALELAAQYHIQLDSYDIDSYSIQYEEFLTFCDAVSRLPLTLEILYHNGQTIRQDVNIVFTSSDRLPNYFDTKSAVVIDLADGKMAGEAGFDLSNNAVVHIDGSKSYMDKIYVDEESGNELMLPMEGYSADSTLTKMKIGPQTVYRSSAGIGMPDMYELAQESETEATNILRYSYVDESGEERFGNATKDNSAGLTEALKGSIFWAGGRRWSLADLCMKLEWIEWGEWGEWQCTFDEKMLNEHVDELWDIVCNGRVIDSVPRIRSDGSLVETDGSGMCRFHIAFDRTGGEDMSTFIEALTGAKDPVVKYELGQIAVAEGLTDGCDYANTRIYEKDIWGNDIEDYRQEYFGTIDPIWYDSIAELYWIEYDAYDNRTLEFIRKTAAENGVTIDENETYFPDFEHVSVSEASVKDYFHITEALDIGYRVCSVDGKNVLERKSVWVTDIRLPEEDTDAYPDSVFQGGRMRIPLQNLEGLEKGVVYNVTAQVQMNNMKYITSWSGGDIPYDLIRYRNGDLVRTYMEDSGRLWYTEYKWGEIVLASKPDVCRNLAYDRESEMFSWEAPEDEGLGTSREGIRRDDYIHVNAYTVKVYDDNHNCIDTITVPNNGDAKQTMILPLTSSRAVGAYTIEVVATNALGDSSVSTLSVDKVISENPDTEDKPGVPEKPDADSGKPEEPGDLGIPDVPDDPAIPGTPDVPETPKAPEDPIVPESSAVPAGPPKTASAPKTGDSTPVGLWLLLLCVSGIGAQVLRHGKRKNMAK